MVGPISNKEKEKKKSEKVIVDPKIDQQENNDDKGKDKKEKSGEDKELSLEERKEILEKVTVPDLKNMCKDANLDRGEWETLKKPALVKYLLEKSEKK